MKEAADRRDAATAWQFPCRLHTGVIESGAAAYCGFALIEIAGKRRRSLAGDVRDAEGGIEPHAEELLQDGGKQHRIAIVEQAVEAAAVSLAGEGGS